MNILKAREMSMLNGQIVRYVNATTIKLLKKEKQTCPHQERKDVNNFRWKGEELKTDCWVGVGWGGGIA